VQFAREKDQGFPIDVELRDVVCRAELRRIRIIRPKRGMPGEREDEGDS
jgi:hypothetical protein